MRNKHRTVKHSVLFRVDAGSRIGMGHFMRCRTLALAMIDKNWEVAFIGSNLPLQMLCKHIKCLTINQTEDLFEDSKQLVDISSSLCIDCLVIDTYAYTEPNFQYIKEKLSGVTVVVIDDTAQRTIVADVIVNPNPMVNNALYSSIRNALCGADYCLLRPEFARVKKTDSNEQILLTLGGGDVSELLIKVLAILEACTDCNIVVSVTDNFPVDKLQPSSKIIINTDMNKFPKLLAQSSMAVVAAGSTLWEVFSLGIPCVTLVWVDNHIFALKPALYKRAAIVVDLVFDFSKEIKKDNIPDIFYSNSIEQIPIAIDALKDINFRNKMINSQKKLIDGQGSLRIVEYISKLID